jgi:multidrug transporter EmrE-like cation transporter
MQWFFLSVAIVSEVVATSALKSSNGFTQFWPPLVVVAGYAVAFFFLSLAFAPCLWKSHKLSGLAPASCSYHL